jgi:hypothetical protein
MPSTNNFYSSARFKQKKHVFKKKKFFEKAPPEKKLQLTVLWVAHKQKKFTHK